MPITKKAALRAIAAQARQRVGLPFDAGDILSQRDIANFAESTEPTYKRFGEYLKGIFPRGGHPDYNHLALPQNAGKTEEGEITTFFMDLKNFTKYCCFLSPRTVYQSKSAAVETAIGVCEIYGGHLHEIPGDGVMFFFGGRLLNHLEYAKKALNAAADTMDLLEKVVMAEYNSKDEYPNIHPKIGIDFGSATWGAFGAHPNYETKATAFHVDIAHKIMSERLSQEVAIGDDLKGFLEIDEEKYLTGEKWCYERQHTVNGETRRICYNTHVFNWRQWLRDRANEETDLAKIHIMGAPAVITGSKTRLAESTPLA